MPSSKFLLLPLCLFYTSSAFSATLYVNPSGVCVAPACFITINAAIAAASDGDIIMIDPGTYIENIIINKEVTLKGSGQGITIIKPAISNIGSVASKGSQVLTSSNVILIQRNNVTIQDIEVNGSNTLIAGIETTVNGVVIDARNGIIVDLNFSNAYKNIQLFNITVRNVFMRAIQVATNSGNENSCTIQNCTVENAQGNSGAIGIFLNFGSGLIQDNILDHAAITVNYTHAVIISRNKISNYGECLHVDNSENIIVDANIIDSRVLNTQALYIFQTNKPVIVSNNIIRNAGVGISVLGSDYGSLVTLKNNIVDGKFGGYAGDPNAIGIYTTTAVPGYAVHEDFTVDASVNNVVKNVATGFQVECTNQFTDIATGLIVNKPGQFINRTTIGNLSFQNIIGNYIELKITGNDSHIKNIDATHVSFDNYQDGVIEGFIIEDKIFHKLDDPSLGGTVDEGLVTFNSKHLYVTNNTGNNSIVRAQHALPVDGLYISPKAGGNYSETVVVANDLQLSSDGSFSINKLQLTAGKQLIVLSPFIIKTSLTLGNGMITNGSNTITIEDNATVSGASDISHINGTVRKVGDESFVFPIGDGLRYRPCAISAPAVSTDAFEAQYYFENALQNLTPSTIILPGVPAMIAVSDKEYWNISRITGSSTPSIKINWRSGISGVVSNSNDLVVARHIQGAGWRNYGANSYQVIDELLWVTINTMPEFGNFALGSTSVSTILPLQSFFLSAENKNNSAVLHWRTTGESGISHFVAEKSFNGSAFSEMGSIKSKGDNIADYNYIDVARQMAKIFYRIRSVGVDGSVNYSNIVSLHSATAGIVIYPNPFSSSLNIYTAKNMGLVQVVNTAGEIILSEKFSGNHFQLNCSSWAKGNYHISVKDAQGQTLAERNVLKQ
jgi:hypothetical protein